MNETYVPENDARNGEHFCLKSLSPVESFEPDYYFRSDVKLDIWVKNDFWRQILRLVSNSRYKVRCIVHNNGWI